MDKLFLVLSNGIEDNELFIHKCVAIYKNNRTKKTEVVRTSMLVPNNNYEFVLCTRKLALPPHYPYLENSQA